MSSPWSLIELTELDLRLRPSAEPEVPIDWAYDSTLSESERVKAWLHQTRDSDPEARTFARSAVQAESWLRIAILVFSALAGIGAATGLLRYGGERLINVSAYVGVLVGGQLLSLMVLAVSGFWLRSRRGILEEVFLPKAVTALPISQSLRAWRWRLFTSFQWGGIAFNLGVLGATLWKVTTFDLAFGWATTLQVEVQHIHSLVEILAWPWGGQFAPTLEQISQSRIVLLDGFATVNSESTAAWWPFLVMCVVCYGLLPRVILAGWGWMGLYRALRSLKKVNPEIQQLMYRLKRKPLTPSDSDVSRPSSTSETSLAALQPTMPMVIEFPKDYPDSLSTSDFIRTLSTSYDIEFSEEQEGTGRLQVVEAWQPPLEETLRHFRDLRQKLGAGKEILLLAVGFPHPEQGYDAPDPKDVSIWKRKLSELRDPNLGIVAWEPST